MNLLLGGSILFLYTKSITTDPAILTNILSNVTDINICLSLTYSDLYKKKYKNTLITANIAML
jgi:anaerobic ribonucleoside-triphosphate reductase